MLSSAVISAFRIPVVVLFKSPIPLDAPVAAKFVIESVDDPKLTTSSNILPEIVYALLTDSTIGAGNLIGVEAVDKKPPPPPSPGPRSV